MRGVDSSSFGGGGDRGGAENTGVGVFSGFLEEEVSDLRGSCSTGKWRGLNYVGTGRSGIVIGGFIGDSGV